MVDCHRRVKVMSWITWPPLWPLTSHLSHRESWEPTLSTLRKEPSRLAGFLSILRCYQEVHSCLPSRETLWVIAGRGLWGQAELRNLRNTEVSLCSWLHWCWGRDTSQQHSPPTKPSSSLVETRMKGQPVWSLGFHPGEETSLNHEFLCRVASGPTHSKQWFYPNVNPCCQS